MARNTRSSLLSELQDTKQALMASERRGRRAVRRLRDIEKTIEPLLTRIRFWAQMPLPDDANAAKVLTVGQCRVLCGLLDAANDDDASPGEEVHDAS